MEEARGEYRARATGVERFREMGEGTRATAGDNRNADGVADGSGESTIGLRDQP